MTNKKPASVYPTTDTACQSNGAMKNCSDSLYHDPGGEVKDIAVTAPLLESLKSKIEQETEEIKQQRKTKPIPREPSSQNEADVRINAGPLTRQTAFELYWLAQKFFQSPVNQAAFNQWQKDRSTKVKVDWELIRG